MTLVLTTLFAALLPFGAPACPASSHQLADRSFFTLCHDASRKVATWVGYETDPSHLARRAARPSHFRRDPQLAASATDSDYRHSGFTRGHLAPAADFAFSDEAIRATFLLSNAVPQSRRLNCGRWSKIEASIRALTGLSTSTVVYTGVLFENGTPATIGDNQVAVPSHLYKVVLVTQDNTRVMFAVIVPNTDSPASSTKDLAVSVDEVERRSGLDFFSQLPDDEERRLESRRVPLPSASSLD